MTEEEIEKYNDMRSSLAMINVNGFLSSIDLRKVTLDDNTIKDIIGTSFDIAEFFIEENNVRNKITEANVENKGHEY